MLSESRYVSIKIKGSKLKERNRELSLLLEINNLLGSFRKLENTFSSVLRKILDFFKMEAGRIYLLGEEDQSLSLIAHQGLDPTGFEKIGMDDSFSGKAARTGAFIANYVSELEDEKRRTLLSSKGFKVIICVPLISMTKVVGVMNIASMDNIDLDSEKIDLFTVIGNQIAWAAVKAKLNEDLRNKIKALKERNELIKIFAYSVSHDLKSPATSMYALTKRLRDKYQETLDEKGNEYCDQILKTAEIMVLLIEKINAYITTKEVPLRLERFDVKEIMQTVRNEFSPILEQQRIKWSEPEHLPEIIGDKMAIARVLQNLVDNALKYGGKDMSQIKIGYKEDEAFHILSIQDDGIGIKTDAKDSIFEMFQRNDSSSGKGGSGLGLAIVREVMTRHGGSAWVSSSSESGAKFFISISKDLPIDL